MRMERHSSQNMEGERGIELAENSRFNHRKINS